MFYGIGDINLPAIDAGLFQGAVEHQPCRSHERFAGKVFLVAGLLADQHHLRILRAFAEHGLGCILPEMTGAAVAGIWARRSCAPAPAAGRRCSWRLSRPEGVPSAS